MQPPFLPLFLVAAATLGLEVSLTRFFAVAHFSEYGYWVLSIAMTGFAFSGVFLSLWKPKAGPLLKWLPLAMLAACGLGYLACGAIPFNALELQHPETLFGQLRNIGLFYLALFPFFFMSGLYVGLCLTRFEGLASKLYAWDLAGAGLGSAYVLAAMWKLPPFQLPLALLPLLGAAAWISGPKKSALALLLALESLLWFANTARLGEYKALSFAAQIEGSKVAGQWSSPRGEFLLLEGPGERLDLDISNNAAGMGTQSLPKVRSLFRDGERIAAFPLEAPKDAPYFNAALEAFPHQIRGEYVALLGSRGGFKQVETGAGTALESDPDIAALAGLKAQPLMKFLSHGFQFELIDLSAEFASQDRFAFTLEALQAGLDRLSGNGLLSVPVSLQENGAGAAKMLAQLRSLLGPDAGKRVIIYRSAWNARFLIWRTPPAEGVLGFLRKFCERRSFDISWAAGFPLAGREPFNDLPTLGFARGEDSSGPARDALAEEAARCFGAGPDSMASARDYDLRPATLDRPFFSSSLRLDRLGDALNNLSMVPREELPLLVNIAVLLQALLLALLVLALPLAAHARLKLGWGRGIRTAYYFSALGLGFMFFEVSLIEKISPWIQDKALAFSLVLAVMLLASGAGSYFSERVHPRPWLPFGGLAAWFLVFWTWADPLLPALSGLPSVFQALALGFFVAPLGFFLGMPFPLGLYRSVESSKPWAWALNGACSVLAPPLAFLLAREQGYKAVALAAFLLYFLAYFALPGRDESTPS